MQLHERPPGKHLPSRVALRLRRAVHLAPRVQRGTRATENLSKFGEVRGLVARVDLCFACRVSARELLDDRALLVVERLALLRLLDDVREILLQDLLRVFR